ncbi:MAG: response regulator [Elainella sp. Prado103]|nr:response regulator [Elainella sp. Prado103]
MPKILLVDDDEQLAHTLKQAFSAKRYLVEVATDSEMGWRYVQSSPHDVIVLDVMLPKQNGIEFCQRLRAERNFTPVLMLTARGDDLDKIKGLEAGADDYLTKPFNFQELLARIRVLLRRGSSTIPDCLSWRDLRLDQNRGQVTYRQQIIPLRTKEYLLLELFLRHKTRIFSQQVLIDLLWDLEEIPTENAVRTHIKGLRQKLKQAGVDDLIETVYGLGYRLRREELSLTNDELPHQPCPEKGSIDSPDLAQPNQAGNPIHASIPTLSILQPTQPSPVARPFRNTTLDVATLTGSNTNPVTRLNADSDPDSDSDPDPSNTGLENPSEQSFSDQFRQAWKRYQSSYFARLQVIEQTVAALANGQLTEALHHQAVQEIHTLKGSLGSFGLVAACQLASTLEQACVDYQTFLHQSPHQQQEWAQQVVALRQSMQAFDTEAVPVESIPIPCASAAGLQIAQPEQSRLLIVEDDLCLGEELAQVAMARGMQVEVVHTLTAAKIKLDQTPPHVILLDLNLSEPHSNGLDLLEAMAMQQHLIPTLVFTAQQGLSERLQVMRGGAQLFLQKPLPPDRVIDLVLQATRRSIYTHWKLLVVADEPTTMETVVQVLEPWGFQTTLLDQPQQFWRMLEQIQPQLLILKADTAEVSGYDLCQIVRNDLNWRHLPILLLVDQTDPQTLHRVFLAGGNLFLPLSLISTELILCVFNLLEQAPSQ